jgi:hypothetical protein
MNVSRYLSRPTTAVVSLLLIALVLGCASGTSGPTATPPPAPTTFTLTVTNGFGSGTYTAGTVVDIFSNPAPTGFVFNAWTGNTSYLADANNWHTTATAAAGTSITVMANTTLVTPVVLPTVAKVPNTDTGTTANRITSPTVPATPITIGYQIPASHPRGIIFEFHGKGGSYIDWFASFDRAYFSSEALADGFGIIAVNAAAPGFWDSISQYPNNLDFSNVQKTITYLVGLGVMSSSDRVYAIGESDGGQFTAAVSRALAFRAGGQQIAPGDEPYFDPTRSIATVNGTSSQITPTIWVLAQQDGTSGVTGPPPYASIIGIGPSGIAQAECNAVEQQTLATPVPTCNTSVTVNPYLTSMPSIQFYMNPPSPAYPARFTVIPGLSSSTQQAIDTWMLSQGCINANGFIPINPYQSADNGANPVLFKCGANELLAQFSAAPNNLTTSQANQLVDQFLVAFSEHHFMAEYTDKMLTYLMAH